MQFISNSQDILFLVLAFCVLLLTAFLVWLLWYAIMSFKQGYEVVKTIKEKIDMVSDIIILLKDKLTSSTSYLSLIITGIKKIVDIVGDKKEERKRKTKK
jgi:hypothetical protein